MNWKEEALEHAKSESPFESCGLLIVFEGKEKYCPCKNLAEEKTDQFIIDPEDWIRCEDQGEILAVVHSHPFDTCFPSQADLASCEYLNYPFYIVGLYDNLWHKFEPSGYKAPLLGRTWVWGSQDCASLVYTWYREKRNIILKDWARPKSVKNFYKEMNFADLIEQTGFKKLKKDQPSQAGDVILFGENDNQQTHIGLYIGNQTMLHHEIRKLSCREFYGKNWLELTLDRYRYA